MTADDKIRELIGRVAPLESQLPPNINSLEIAVGIFFFGTTLANSIDELRNGRAEMIRATGAVLIASVLLYF